jgi:Flp pilus assembly pilin Flp
MTRLFADLMREESGQDLVEYALLVCVIGLASIAVVGRFADSVLQVYDDMAEAVKYISVRGRL